MSNHLTTVILEDQSFFGGNTAKLYRKSESFIRIVYIENEMKEKRFKFVPKDEFFILIEDLLQKHEFLGLPENPSRPGVPDEAHPKITLRFDSGEVKKVWKWANDPIPDFDPFYSAILDYINQIEKSIKPVYKGKFDPTFQ
jgi:hypothetical protein